MHQINKQDCKVIGYVRKIHGSRGEVIASIEDEFLETIKTSEYLFIEIDGGLVPFFISKDGLSYRNNENVVLRLDFVDSSARAEELVGCKIYISEKDKPSRKDNSESFISVEGMEIIDENRGNIGKITGINDFSGNVVITVKNPKGEILIPLNDRIIKKIDYKNRKLYLECPEGLIDIYIE
jgi:16S rRNA processing protein RimM